MDGNSNFPEAASGDRSPAADIHEALMRARVSRWTDPEALESLRRSFDNADEQHR